MTVTVRRAAIEDSAALAALRWTWRVDEAGEQPSTALEYAERLRAWWAARPDHLAVLAEEHSAVQHVGMAWLALGDRVPGPAEARGRSAWLQSLYIRPDRRNRGIGGRVIAFVAELARAQGCAFVAVHPSPASMSVYHRAGFEAADGLRELRLHR